MESAGQNFAVAFPYLALAFVMGSLPFGAWLGRLRGVDVQQTGSGNLGATNVARTMGWQAGVLVLLLDALKAAVPTYLAWRFTGWTGAMAAAAAFAVLGHVYSPWLKFRGGKGVATTLGGLLVVHPLAAGLCVLVFAVVVGVSRMVSLGSMAAALVLPWLLFMSHADPAALYFGAMAAFLVIRNHKANLQRIVVGKEPKWGQTPPETES